MKFQNIAKQKGFTFWSFIWSAVMVVCISYLLIIGIPPYLGNQKLYRGLERLAEEPKIHSMNRTTMIKLLNRQLNIDYADSIVDLNSAFRAHNTNGNKALSINYEMVIPVFYNVSLLLDFKNEVIAIRK
jgi:hypothetical protein